MFKKTITFFWISLLTTFGFSQIYDPVDWTFQVEQSGTEATLIFTATIEEGWHVYSQTLESDDGPVATEVTFVPNSNYELVGKTIESKTYNEFDPNFDMNLSFFKTKAVLKQKIKLKTDKKFTIKGNVYFMVCNESMCLPPSDSENEFVLNTSSKEVAPEEVMPDKSNIEQSSSLGLSVEGSDKKPENHESSKEISDPVKVKVTSKKIGDNLYELTANIEIQEHWHVFSSKQDGMDGPIPTEFNLFDSTKFELIGELLETGKKITKQEDGFEIPSHFYENEVVFKRQIKVEDPTKPVYGELYFQTCIGGKCILKNPIFKLDLTTGEDLMAKEVGSIEKAEGECNPKKFEGKEQEQEKVSLIGMFFLAFLFGLTTLLTPCVFPMIPMTVSFFMKDKGKGIRNAIVFGLSIIAIYTLIGTLVSVLFGASFSNWLATHWIPNVTFFFVFVMFAASFFGMFEITMPSWIVNKADKGADRGGLIGVFFMALTLVVVSFSCTGPIVGVILINAAQGQLLEPMIGMFGFSLAFAIPFTLFAIFPSMLNKLPQSGGWLNSVKVVLGFLELALALKFLSVADQTYHWGLLDRHIYIALWIVIFGLMGMYLLGKIKFSHDSDIAFLKVPRLIFAIIVFSFTIYLIPGLFGSPLKMLAGYLPPMSTHEFNLLGAINGEEGLTCDESPKYSDKLHLPHGIKGYFDYDEAIACAKSQGKPLFIDFTGHGCVNCRKMEASVWSDPRILKMLKEEFVVVALYCDEKKIMLPEDEWYNSKFDGRLKKTLGDKNLDFQICSFGGNAQPLYALLDNDEELCAPTVGTLDYDRDAFYNHLKSGLEVFNIRNRLNR